MTNSSEPTSLFLRACRRLPTNRPPIWLMRQAGRYMTEYREIRSKHSMLTVIGTPELAAEVTLQPIHKFGFDAAIIFADILPPLEGMGLHLELPPVARGISIQKPFYFFVLPLTLEYEGWLPQWFAHLRISHIRFECRALELAFEVENAVLRRRLNA